MHNHPIHLLVACALGFMATCSAAQFKHQTIDDKIQIGYGLAVSDVNGDGKPDILLVDKQQVVWYQNPHWQKHVIAENLTRLDHVCIAALDLDGDRKCEIAIGAGWNPGDTVNSGAVFYLKPNTDRTKTWTSIPLHHEPTVHRMWWVRSDPPPATPHLIVAPLHGRGNVSGAGEGVRILEYTLPSDPTQPWKTKLVDDSLHMTHNLDPVQWDSDPEEEILLCGKEAVILLDKQDGKWHRTELINAQKNPGFVGAGEVRLGSNRGKPYIATIEPMHGTNLVVYTGEKTGAQWKRHVLDSSLNDGHALACGQFNARSKNLGEDLVVGWRGKNAQGKVGLKIFKPSPDFTNWTSDVLDDDGMACEDVKLADLNGDGLTDIVAAGRATKNVKIYWNQGN